MNIFNVALHLAALAAGLYAVANIALAHYRPAVKPTRGLFN